MVTENGSDVETGAEPRPARPWRVGLSGKLLLLTILFVMVAEIFIYVPSVANFRLNWLSDRLAAAHTAALVLDAALNGKVETLFVAEGEEQSGSQSYVPRDAKDDKALQTALAHGTVARRVETLIAPGLQATGDRQLLRPDAARRAGPGARAVAASATLLDPLVSALERYVLAAAKLRPIPRPGSERRSSCATTKICPRRRSPTCWIVP